MVRRAALFLTFALLVVDRPAGLAQDSAVELSATALQECELGRRAADRNVRLAHFEKSEAIAKQALAQNDQVADAHFALFCSVGEQMRIDGESITSLVHFRRMMKALDRTLELNPDHLDALSSKGTLLVTRPFMMGGNEEQGQQILRRVGQRDPTAINARLALAKVYASHGRHREALTLATEALANCQAQQRADLIPEAQATVSSLRNNRASQLSP